MLEQIGDQTQLLEELQLFRARVVALENLQNQQQQIEKHLRQQYEDTLDKVNDSVTILDHEWRYLYVNRAFENISKRSRQEVLGKVIWESYPATVPMGLLQQYQKVVNEQVDITFEVFYEESGSWWEIRAYPHNDGLIAFIHNITVLKQTEASLAFQTDALSQISDAVVVTDTKRCVTYWNKAAEQFYELNSTQAIGRNLDELYVTLWNNEREHQNSVQAIAKKGFWRSEVRQRKASGEEVYVDASISLLKDRGGQPIGLLGIIRDITTRKQAEIEREKLLMREQVALQRLSESEERMRVATEAAEIGIWFWNLVTDDLQFTDKCKALFGIDHDTIMNYNRFAEALHPDDRSPTDEAIARSLLEKNDYSMEYRTVWPDQSIHWLAAKGRCFYDNEGKVASMMGVVIDIDERKRAEEELRKLDQLKDEFLIIAGHELRTPLTSIKGYTQLLQRRVSKHADLEKEVQLLGSVDHQVNRMSGLINEMLDISRIDRGQLQLNYSPNRDLVKLVQIVVEQQQVTTSNHELTFESNVEQVVGTFDEPRLEQVLNNLISNAIKYSEPSQPVHISLNYDPVTNMATIAVRDKGIGINPQQQKNLFSRFYRVRETATNKIDGLGLGLYISRGIIERHGGRIWLESEVNVGSTFYFTLPLVSNTQVAVS